MQQEPLNKTSNIFTQFLTVNKQLFSINKQFDDDFILVQVLHSLFTKTSTLFVFYHKVTTTIGTTYINNNILFATRIPRVSGL